MVPRTFTQPNQACLYYFADYCSDKIWTLHNVGGGWTSTLYGQFSGNNFSTFGEDASGQLYIAGLKSGTIYRINTGLTVVKKISVQPDIKVINLTSSGKVRVKTGLSGGAKMQLYLVNTLGEVFYNAVSKSSTYEIDVRMIPNEIYFLNIVLTDKKR